MKRRLFPEYSDNYFYATGSSSVVLERKKGENIIARKLYEFYSPGEAEKFYNSL